MKCGMDTMPAEVTSPSYASTSYYY